MRIGSGYDVHKLVKGRDLILGGVKIPFEIGPRRAGDLPEFYANADRAAELLGWKAERTMDDMCRDGFRWQTMNPMGYPED